MGLGTLCALSFGPMSNFTIAGLTVFNLFDYLSSNILLPLGGMLISIFVGWIVDRRLVRSQLAGTGNLPHLLLRAITFCLRYVAPAGILLVFLSGLNII